MDRDVTDLGNTFSQQTNSQDTDAQMLVIFFSLIFFNADCKSYVYFLLKLQYLIIDYDIKDFSFYFLSF